jgi:NADPH:quinone reductase-like Zn-dependent oxidoreductase
MKAAWFERFGAASDVLVVGEKDDPEPGPGEVLVKVIASGVNPSDVKKRAGSFPALLDEGYVIPHSDCAGIVEAVGAGVDSHRVGDRVWVYQAQFERRFGTAAEYVAIDALRAPLLPSNASYEVGACLGIPAMTAHRCVFAGGGVDGQTVLVTGGAGRVGYYAIQWAVRSGARVIATASNDEDAAACLKVGASEVINHRNNQWSRDVLAANGGQPVDRVIDVEFGANLPQVLEAIRVGGRIVTYSSTVEPEPKLPFFKVMYMDLTIQAVIVYAMPEAAKRRAVLDIESALHEESLDHRIAARYGLSDIAQAHELIEQGNCRGTVVVEIS